jgi:predicted esterase
MTVLTLALAAGWVSAQTRPTSQPSRETVQQFLQLEQQLGQLLAGKHYEESLPIIQQQIDLIPNTPGPYYNRACVQAQLGHPDEALVDLEKTLDNGYADVLHLRTDPDLESLREKPKFKEILARTRENQLKAPHEAGREIKEVRTIEGFPEAGLRYRIRHSLDASAAKPDRLIIWFHPSGGSGDDMIESLSPQFAKHGFAVMVLTQKQFGGWTGPELEALLNKTLPDVATHKEIDCRRPILMGFSAGGQMALMAWMDNPTGFSGLVLDAAYPVIQQANGQYKGMPLPKGEAATKTPMFVLIGGADGVAGVWKQAEPIWNKAGVPLTIHYIPNRQHEWLFGPAQVELLLAWLDDVKAGKATTQPATAPTSAPAEPAPTTEPATW